jgi:DNA polymerase-1
MDQKKQLTVERRIVTRENFFATLEFLSKQSFIALDTETTGLRPHHGDRIFSLVLAIIGDAGDSSYTSFYFNFNQNPDPNAPEPLYLGDFTVLQSVLFANPQIRWFIHNAKFDLAMLAKHGCKLSGQIHCTRAQGRVEYNEHMSYSLDNCAKRVGYAKDDTVEKYISEHKLWEWVEIPGKSVRAKIKFYDRVPFEIIFPYACYDAALCLHLGESQAKAFLAIDEEARAKNTPSILQITENERKLTKLVFNMEYRGLRIDRDYVEKAAQWWHQEQLLGMLAFQGATGQTYKASPKLFAEVFQDHKDKWEYTDKNNPSFESDTLKKFGSPVAEQVLRIRDAKSKCDFFNGFLWHADSDNFIHPILNPDGTATGRFSSSEPNFQNLTSEDSSHEWTVRRAIVPSEAGGMLISLDYDQMEYRVMLDLACKRLGEETELVRKILGGLDVHQAVADLAKVTRTQAKTTNFLTIYGGGNEKLAEQLGCSVEQAQAIRQAIFDAAPEIRDFIRAVTRTAENRGYVFNWAGRRCYFPDRNFAYKAPNYLIQGGCADVVKFAMPRIQEMLDNCFPGVRIVLQVHDELILDVPFHSVERAKEIIQAVKDIMESTYPHKFLPLTVGAEWSMKSLGDMEEV